MSGGVRWAHARALAHVLLRRVRLFDADLAEVDLVAAVLSSDDGP